LLRKFLTTTGLAKHPADGYGIGKPPAIDRDNILTASAMKR